MAILNAKASRKLFVNLPVRDLARAMEFFARLGFEFDRRFTDDKAACMVIGDGAYAMLLTTAFFQTFTKNAICDTRAQTEALLAISCASRGQVDAMVKTALEHGGRAAMPSKDHGFMYGWSFYDPDGHHWEVLWMDEAKVPPATDPGRR